MKRFKGINKNLWNYFLELFNFFKLLAANFLSLVLSNIDAIGSRLGSCDESARAASSSKHVSKLRESSRAGLL